MYTDEKNILMLISLLKQYKIKYIIASPGATNITFLKSLQNDDWFKIYSCVDERSACYMACGIAADKNEPVVLTCTGATASRNYLSGLTEAYYRKLPVLAVTSTQNISRVGTYTPQVIDRSVIQNDVAIYNTTIDKAHSPEEKRANNLKINEALINLTINKGPVHINLVTEYSHSFSVVELPKERKINYYTNENDFPRINNKKVAIFVGNHQPMSEKLISEIDKFCESYDAFVCTDLTSNYKGKYGVQFSIVAAQTSMPDVKIPDLIIHIGHVSGAYMDIRPSKVWRVNQDGKLIDTFGKLNAVFKIKEEAFFEKYNKLAEAHCHANDSMNFYEQALKEKQDLIAEIPDLPFSNAWIAENSICKLPKNCNLHLGILNSLRCWNFFDIDNSINCFCNTGGFGIDGCLSSCIGSAIASPDKLHFIILGDLSFFYDMNSLGNNNIPANLRVLVINNGCGTEFKNYNHFAAEFGEDANRNIAAMGHFGNKSKKLVKNYVENLGFKYLSASNKKEYIENFGSFTCQDSGQSIVFEVFTDWQDESNALKIINNLNPAGVNSTEYLKQGIKKVIGQSGVNKLKNIKSAISDE